jgi:NADPH:quinone reductase-like Zn-dependent oxidoreductase
MAELKQDDLNIIATLMQTGKVTSVIDKRYPMAQSAEAIRYLETGRARGKVVVTIE